MNRRVPRFVHESATRVDGRFPRAAHIARSLTRFASLKRVLVSLAIAALALVSQLGTASRVFADGPSCPLGMPLTGTNPPSYQSYGCAFSDAAYFSPNYRSPLGSGGQYLHVNVYIDLNVAPQFSTNLVNDITTAMSNWTGSAAHVYVTRVYGTNYSNLVRFVPDACGLKYSDGTCHFKSDNCSGIAADTTTVVTPHLVMFNEHYFGKCSDATWTYLAAHELGHAMGLGHNTNCSPQCQLMNPTPKVSSPQSIDIDIFNKIYPFTPCLVTVGDTNCDYQDYQAQSCNSYAQGGAYNTSLITVTLYYSTNCQSNWTLATLHDTTNYSLYKVDIERQSPYAPTSLLEYPTYNSWYTNMLWAPNFSARSCAWIVSNTVNHVYGPYCSSWV